MLPIIGLALGVVLGLLLPYNIDSAYSIYVAIAILASFDSILGGIKGVLEKNFVTVMFVSGLVTNSILAVAISYIGDMIGIPLYLAAIFAFGNRIFDNFGFIRRDLYNKFMSKREAKKEAEAMATIRMGEVFEVESDLEKNN